jgi:hypothetical protein
VRSRGGRQDLFGIARDDESRSGIVGVAFEQVEL